MIYSTRYSKSTKTWLIEGPRGTLRNTKGWLLDFPTEGSAQLLVNNLNEAAESAALYEAQHGPGSSPLA